MGAPKGDPKKPQQSCTTYLSLIQQYLAVLQVDNATWLAERCIAEYPQSSEAAYLLGYCYYRAGKVKNARAWLAQQSAPTPTMLYLSALCCYDLADYAAGEAILLKELRSAYAKSRETTPMDDWILLASVRCIPLLLYAPIFTTHTACCSSSPFLAMPGSKWRCWLSIAGKAL